MLKILHFGDIHCRDKDIEEVRKCLYFICEQAEIEQPDLINVAGDTFDGRGIKLDSPSVKLIFEVFSRLAAIAPVAVVTGTPFHDGQTVEVLSYVRAQHPVYVATAPGQMLLLAGQFRPIDGAVNGNAILSFVPTPTKQYYQGSDQDVSKAMNGMFAGFGAVAEGYDCPHLLVFHGSISGATLSNDQVMIGREIEISRDQIQLAKPTIVLAGHIHLPQEIEPNIFYSGSIYANNRGEAHKHGFYVHELAEN